MTDSPWLNEEAVTGKCPERTRARAEGSPAILHHLLDPMPGSSSLKAVVSPHLVVNVPFLPPVATALVERPFSTVSAISVLKLGPRLVNSLPGCTYDMSVVKADEASGSDWTARVVWRVRVEPLDWSLVEWTRTVTIDLHFDRISLKEGQGARSMLTRVEYDVERLGERAGVMGIAYALVQNSCAVLLPLFYSGAALLNLATTPKDLWLTPRRRHHHRHSTPAPTAAGLKGSFQQKPMKLMPGSPHSPRAGSPESSDAGSISGSSLGTGEFVSLISLTHYSIRATAFAIRQNLLWVVGALDVTFAELRDFFHTLRRFVTLLIEFALSILGVGIELAEEGVRGAVQEGERVGRAEHEGLEERRQAASGSYRGTVGLSRSIGRSGQTLSKRVSFSFPDDREVEALINYPSPPSSSPPSSGEEGPLLTPPIGEEGEKFSAGEVGTVDENGGEAALEESTMAHSAEDPAEESINEALEFGPEVDVVISDDDDDVGGPRPSPPSVASASFDLDTLEAPSDPSGPLPPLQHWPDLPALEPLPTPAQRVIHHDEFARLRTHLGGYSGLPRGSLTTEDERRKTEMPTSRPAPHVTAAPQPPREMYDLSPRSAVFPGPSSHVFTSGSPPRPPRLDTLSPRASTFPVHVTPQHFDVSPPATITEESEAASLRQRQSEGGLPDDDVSESLFLTPAEGPSPKESLASTASEEQDEELMDRRTWSSPMERSSSTTSGFSASTFGPATPHDSPARMHGFMPLQPTAERLDRLEDVKGKSSIAGLGHAAVEENVATGTPRSDSKSTKAKHGPRGASKSTRKASRGK